MEIIYLEFKENSQDILSFLKGNVFHLTTKSSFEKIIECGFLLNNKNAQFKMNPSSQKSFGRSCGYICFFDLRNIHNINIDDILDRYNFINPNWFKKRHDDILLWELAYMVLKSEKYEKLIPSQDALKHYFESGEFLQAIPKVEVWIDNFVPIEWIEKTYLVRYEVQKPEFDR